MASIRERAAKGSGRPTYSVLYRHGTRQTSTTFATKKAANEFKSLVEILGPDPAIKSLNAAGESRLTVAELAEKFLERKARDVTPRTLTDYRRDIDNWVLPWFGHRAAASIDEGDVQEWVDHMATRLSPKSTAGRHMILHSMFSFGRAKSRQLVDHNPCMETDLPRREKKPPKGLTIPEFRAILEVAAERNPAAHDLILFMGETGWRWSEAAALPVGAVDDDGRYLTVTVTQVFRVDGSGRQTLAVDSAKSQAAFRRIRMFDDSAGVLRQRLVGRGVSDLAFTTARGRRWNQNTFLRDVWPGLLTEAGLWRGPGESPTPHWLRHMHVGVLSAMGVGVQEIRRRIGHESISTTFNVYGGMVGDLDDAALGRGSDLMAGRRSAPTIAPTVVGEILSSDR